VTRLHEGLKNYEKELEAQGLTRGAVRARDRHCVGELEANPSRRLALDDIPPIFRPGALTRSLAAMWSGTPTGRRSPISMGGKTKTKRGKPSADDG
jgi:hypothetical protein